ncbi:MAG TPA: hypothetical protein VGP43_02480 [Chitinophagaceae bacterium]|nr:hypothetical protein [Chitinophagaceae bacterium]
MGLNVSGGALEFEGVINAEQFFSTLHKMEDELKKVAASGAGANQKMIDDIQKQFSGLTNSLESGQLKISQSSSGFGEAILEMAGGISVGALALEGLKKGLELAIEYFNRESEATKRAAENIKILNEVNEDANKQAAEDSVNLKILYEATQNVTLSNQERIKAANELQALYPTIFKNFNAENILLGEAKSAYDKLTASIYANARAEAGKKKLVELQSKRLDKETEQQKIEDDFDRANLEHINKLDNKKLSKEQKKFFKVRSGYRPGNRKKKNSKR